MGKRDRKTPISISKRHFPDMAHLGDVTKLDGREIPPVHITGTTMKRPGFQKMLTAIEAGYISAVFVKDYCAIIGLNQKDLENQGILA